MYTHPGELGLLAMYILLQGMTNYTNRNVVKSNGKLFYIHINIVVAWVNKAQTDI